MVYISLVHMSALLIFRSSTPLLRDFAQSGEYLNSTAKVVSVLVAPLIPDAVGDFFIFAILRWYNVDVLQHWHQSNLRGFLTKVAAGSFVLTVFLVLSINRDDIA